MMTRVRGRLPERPAFRARSARRQLGRSAGDYRNSDLFIAKQFVEGHGGHFEIESKNDVENHSTIVRDFSLFRDK
jgi:hypothetical protein